MFKAKGRDYHHSIELENIAIDIDAEGYVTGIQVFDASNVFNSSKLQLKQVSHFEFNTEVEDNVIKINIQFVSKARSKPAIRQGQNLIREVAGIKVEDCKVVCTI